MNIPKKNTTELALKQKQQRLQQRIKTLSCSSSQDQQHYSHRQPQHLIDGSSYKSSELKQQANAGSPFIHPNVSYSSNWQLLTQHITTRSLDNSDILNNTCGNTELSTSVRTRRCSVPAALSYQRQKLSTASPLSIVNDHANINVSLSRRTSMVSSPLPSAMDPNDSLIQETKRRVRMINRH